MTEDEAKKKWCPMARVNCEGASGNRRVSRLVIAKEFCCLGSKCMIWISQPSVKGMDDKDEYGYCGFVK